MQGALTRYRIIAWIVGVVLVVLMLVAMPMKYIGHDGSLVAAVSPVHGFLYMLYLVATFDLSRRVGWAPKRMLLVMLAGTIPVFSFWAEHIVTRRWVAPAVAAEPVLAEK
ncbi:DUF3817 domain-containing protein [Actinoplanes sp. NPDC051859]|uniref:DUF3817 domain-containing protein n=1 Tax=Actinoplanes sp. NPDC051859 TaxID=3363909 RepID=UPI0037937C04